MAETELVDVHKIETNVHTSVLSDSSCALTGVVNDSVPRNTYDTELSERQSASGTYATDSTLSNVDVIPVTYHVFGKDAKSPPCPNAVPETRQELCLVQVASDGVVDPSISPESQTKRRRIQHNYR